MDDAMSKRGLNGGLTELPPRGSKHLQRFCQPARAASLGIEDFRVRAARKWMLARTCCTDSVDDDENERNGTEPILCLAPFDGSLVDCCPRPELGQMKFVAQHPQSLLVEMMLSEELLSLLHAAHSKFCEDRRRHAVIVRPT